MARRGLTHKDVSLRLSRLAIHVLDRTVMRRIGRASFSASFLLQVLTALGVRWPYGPEHVHEAAVLIDAIHARRERGDSGG